MLNERDVEFFPETESTNTTALEMARSGAPEWTTVAAGVQTAGRGRKGNIWHSPEGGLWFSVVLRPKLAPDRVTLLTLAAGVAVANALDELYGLKPKLKWVNDVTLDGKKACGILTETSITGGKLDFAVVGIGINTNLDTDSLPEEIREQSTTIKEHLDYEINNYALMDRILSGLEVMYESLETDPSSIIARWKERSETLGRMVSVDGKDGKAVDVTENGALVLETESGERKEVLAGMLAYMD